MTEQTYNEASILVSQIDEINRFIESIKYCDRCMFYDNSDLECIFVNPNELTSLKTLAIEILLTRQKKAQEKFDAL